VRRRVVAAAFGFLVLAFALPLGAEEIRFEGNFTQGGLVRGGAPPGTAITLDGRHLRVSPEGYFAFGFDRDAPPEAVLVVSYPGGEQETRGLAVAPRDYRIQRIDGLPEKWSRRRPRF